MGIVLVVCVFVCVNLEDVATLMMTHFVTTTITIVVFCASFPARANVDARI